MCSLFPTFSSTLDKCHPVNKIQSNDTYKIICDLVPILSNEYGTVDLAFVFMTVNISWITNNNSSCIINANIQLI